MISTANPKAIAWKAIVERACRDAIASSGRAAPLFTGPVRVSMQFNFRATSVSPPGKPHTIKPDKDNLEKLVLDVMERCGVYHNDSQVAAGPVSKMWAMQGGLSVLVEPLAASGVAVSVETLAGDAPAWLKD